MTIGIQVDDLLTRVLDLIDSGSIDEAVRIIVEREFSEGSFVVYKLLKVLVGELGKRYDGERLIDLDRPIILALDLNRALDLELESDRTRTLALTLSLARDLAFALSGDLKTLIGIADIIVKSLAFWLNSEAARDEKRQGSAQDVMHHTKDGLQEPLISTMIFDGLDRLTPENLSNQVAPYLQAIFDVQQIVDEFEVQAGKVAVQPRIVSISQNSPIQVSVEGIGKAFDIISMMVIPWKRENAKKRDDSAVAQEELKIVVAQAEIAEKKLQSAQNQKLAVLELEQKRLDIREKQLDLDKREREGFEEALRMAFRILDEVAPSLSAEQRIARAIDLTRGMKVIKESRLEIRAG